MKIVVNKAPILIKMQEKKGQNIWGTKKCLFFQFSSRFWITELRGKGHEPSQAESKILQLDSDSSLLTSLAYFDQK